MAEFFAYAAERITVSIGPWSHSFVLARSISLLL